MKRKWVTAILVGCLAMMAFFTSTIYQPPSVELQPPTPVSMMVPMESVSQRNWMQKTVAQFEKETGGEVALQFVSYPQVYEWVYRQNSGQNLPDVMVLDNVWLQSYYQTGLLAPLDEVIEEVYLNDLMMQKLINGAKYGGQSFGIPFRLDSYALFCNVDLLQKYNLEPPTDWESMMAVSEELLREPAASFAIAGAQGEDLTNQMLQLLYQNGGDLYLLEEADAVSVYENLETMVELRLLSKECVNWNEADLMEKFFSREVAMILASSQALPLLEEAAPDFTWIAVPVLGDSPIGTATYTQQSLTVAADTELETVTPLLTYLSSKEVLQQMTDEQGSLPVRIDVSDAYFEGKYQVFLDEYQRAKSTPSLSLWQNISLSIQDSFVALQLGENSRQVAQEVRELVDINILEG